MIVPLLHIPGTIGEFGYWTVSCVIAQCIWKYMLYSWKRSTLSVVSTALTDAIATVFFFLMHLCQHMEVCRHNLQVLPSERIWLIGSPSSSNLYAFSRQTCGVGSIGKTFLRCSAQCKSLSMNSSLMECLLRDILQSGMSNPKSAHSSVAVAIPDDPTTPPLLGMVMVWRTRKCTASITRWRWSSPPAPMAAMAEAVMLLLERRSCWPW